MPEEITKESVLRDWYAAAQQELNEPVSAIGRGGNVKHSAKKTILVELFLSVTTRLLRNEIAPPQLTFLALTESALYELRFEDGACIQKDRYELTQMTDKSCAKKKNQSYGTYTCSFNYNGTLYRLSYIGWLVTDHQGRYPTSDYENYNAVQREMDRKILDQFGYRDSIAK